MQRKDPVANNSVSLYRVPGISIPEPNECIVDEQVKTRGIHSILSIPRYPKEDVKNSQQRIECREDYIPLLSD